MGLGRAHQPADIVVQHLPQRLVELELVAAFVGGPEGHDRLQGRAAGDGAGHLGNQDRGLCRQLETPSGPALNGLQTGKEGRIRLGFSEQHQLYRKPVLPYSQERSGPDARATGLPERRRQA